MRFYYICGNIFAKAIFNACDEVIDIRINILLTGALSNMINYSISTAINFVHFIHAQFPHTFSFQDIIDLFHHFIIHFFILLN